MPPEHWEHRMRLKFVDAEDQREAAFLAALASGAEIPPGDGGIAALLGAAEPRAIGPADIVEAVLHFNGAAPALIQAVLGRRRRGEPDKLLAAGLKSVLKFGRLPDPARSRLMLIGPPAAGKTTMMAKLAARGRAPTATVFSTDGERPGGIAQLADPLQVLGIEPERLDPTAPIQIAGSVLIDTAGSAAEDGFAALGELARAMSVEPVLVLPATIDADEARKFARAAQVIGARSLLVTRLDIARRLGGPLAAAETGLALVGGSVTPNFAYGLKPLGAAALAGHLLRLAEQRAAGLASPEG
jgi:flagellar biosynthesis protein FlhF